MPAVVPTVVHVLPLTDDSHLTIAPVPPDVVKVPEFEPLHTNLVASDGLSKVTATVVASTVIALASDKD